ncbi:helix-turn-helix transcriptional regulator [Chamaesiphon sp. VAR_48_metabat_403]|uniref:helix-turn-helix transcriptional regulator n=1 Tax=Chamaesiphon sp. VAR_48_metabat_403 TaxID=2964700 RepID=UPI00286E131A|nr:helix-turn-helix transcriptional regulator [Chamaesiphon sp. VAR_48_metabat_403]
MTNDRLPDRTLQLQALMHKVGINSFRQLSRSTGTSARTIGKLRSGNLDTLRWQTLVKISSVLQISIGELIATFGSGSILVPFAKRLPQQRGSANGGDNDRELATLKQEYQYLQHQFQQQQTTLAAEFRATSLQTLESFLTYFPTAKYAAENNPNFPASKLFPLVQSIDRLISDWGVTVIGEVGAIIPYDPRWHQLIEGTATTAELVTVRYVGYRQADKPIFRAKVSR